MTFNGFTRSKNFYCCRFVFSTNTQSVSRAQKISTVVDITAWSASIAVSRAQKISTVVDVNSMLSLSLLYNILSLTFLYIGEILHCIEFLNDTESLCDTDK